MERFEYDAVVHETPDSGGAYVAFPWDIRARFGKGRLKVHAEFDGVPYDGSVVNMGVKNPDGSVCYVIGVLKAIRTKLGKRGGDTIHVVIEPKETEDTAKRKGGAVRHEEPGRQTAPDTREDRAAQEADEGARPAGRHGL